MPITATNIKEIRQEFAKLKPATVTLDGNRAMTVKQVIFTLTPTLERMKKRGFNTQELVEKLHEKGIEVKPPTFAKYLSEFRRQKGAHETQRQDTPRPLRQRSPAFSTHFSEAAKHTVQVDEVENGKSEPSA